MIVYNEILILLTIYLHVLAKKTHGASYTSGTCQTCNLLQSLICGMLTMHTLVMARCVTNRKHCVIDYFLYYVMDFISNVCMFVLIVEFSLVFPLV